MLVVAARTSAMTRSSAAAAAAAAWALLLLLLTLAVAVLVLGPPPAVAVAVLVRAAAVAAAVADLLGTCGASSGLTLTLWVAQATRAHTHHSKQSLILINFVREC